MVMRTWIVLALVGCGSTAPVPPPSHQVARPTACLPSRFHDAAIEYLTTQGDRATLCYRAVEERDGDFAPSGWEASDRACFAIDGRGAIVGEVSYENEPAAPPEKSAAHTITWSSGTAYQICDARQKCVAVSARHAPGDPHMAQGAIVSDDGRRAFVMNARPRGNNGGFEIWGELLDVAAARSISDFRLTENNAFSDISTTRAVEMYGDHVAIGIFHAGPCCGTWLFDARDGKRVPLHDWDGHRMKIDASTLMTMDGHTASVVDIATLRTLKSLAIPGVPYGRDGQELRSSAMVQMPNGALIAHARPAGIVVFDAKTRSLQGAREIPLCDGPVRK